MTTAADETTRGLRIGALALCLGIVALVLWDNRDDIADQFTSSYGVRIRLVTPSPQDKGRLEEAFAVARSQSRVEATLEAATDSHFNSAELVGSSPTQAVEAGETFARAVAASFDAAGTGRLETEVGQRAYPLSDATSDTVKKLTMGGALVLGALGIVLAHRVWRRFRVANRLPPWAGIALAIGLFLPVAPILMPGWLVAAAFAMMIPSSIAGVILYKMDEVRRAARWPSVQGRIVRSRLRAADTKNPDGSRGRGNLPDIRYAFSVDGVDYRGERIGIGEIRPNTPEVQAALERYQVGRTGPVFYNPDNPTEAVLDRDPPASPRTMYAIAAGVMLVGLAVVVTFTVLGEIVAWLQPYFPPRAFIPGFLFFLVCGLFAGMIMIANMAIALRAARWPTTPGTVITSRAESRREATSGSSNRSMVVWSPLVEYEFKVGARKYHGTGIAFGPSVSGGRAFAEAIVARYPVDAAVTVHYDPANPSQATLETEVAFRWIGLSFVLGCFVVAFLFSGRL